jgi:hypothetical protein
MGAADWEKRAIFAKEYAASGNGTQSAIAAGVPAASAHAVAYKWLRNTEVLALIRNEIDARLKDLGPIAVDVMRQVMMDERTPPQTRLSAARDVLDRLGWIPPKRTEAIQLQPKRPEEYTNEELIAIIHNAKANRLCEMPGTESTESTERY